MMQNGRGCLPSPHGIRRCMDIPGYAVEANGCRALHAKGLMRTICMVFFAPFEQLSTGIVNVVKRLVSEQFAFHRTMKTFDFALRLRMPDSAVKWSSRIVRG